MPTSWKSYLAETLITEEEIKTRVAELGQRISADYDGKDLVLICVLKGAVLFLTDLTRAIDIPHEMDFLAVSSYERGVRESTGVVRFLKDLDDPIAGRDVLIVEDIIDTGHTINYILRNLTTRQPASLKVCALLDKIERRQVEVDIHYSGFVIPDKFVFGYGLDLDQKFRNLPFIGVVKPGAVVEA